MLLIHRGTDFIPSPKESYDMNSNWRRIQNHLIQTRFLRLGVRTRKPAILVQFLQTILCSTITKVFNASFKPSMRVLNCCSQQGLSLRWNKNHHCLAKSLGQFLPKQGVYAVIDHDNVKQKASVWFVSFKVLEVTFCVGVKTRCAKFALADKNSQVWLKSVALFTIFFITG